MSELRGCKIEPLDSKACEHWLAWLNGESGDGPPNASGLVWAVAHSDEGVTWGRYDGDQRSWHLGNQCHPEISPPIRRTALQELRIFGTAAEVLIWKADEDLRGRLIGDTSVARASEDLDPLRPSEESRMVRGDRVADVSGSGFSRLVDRAGAEQVIPIAVNEDQLRERKVRLLVKHYYEQDQETGAVRVAATRLVKLAVEG